MMGGFGSAKNADANTMAICKDVKGKVETKLGKEFKTFEPIQYTTQVVAGTNYKIKVKTDEDYLHIKVHKPLPHNGTELQILEAEGGFSAESAL